MRIVLLLSFVLAVHPALAQTQTQKPASPPQPRTGTTPSQTPPATPQPQPPRTTPPATTAPRRPATTTRGGLAITVTSPQGATLPDIRVQVNGPTERSGELTNASGQLTMPSLLTGTYRLRFEGEKVTTFEKEVIVQTGKVTEVDVVLNPAPEPKVVALPPPEPTPTATIGPKGEARTLGVVNTLEKDYVGKQARRESLLACTGNLRTSMIQLNDPMPTRLYDSADAMYYVLGGEGTIQMNGKETKLATYDFASVPRGTSHSFTRRGSRALVLLAVLSGEPCEQAK